MSQNLDFINGPWWNTGPDDYTKHRSGKLNYSSMDDLIGRKDTSKYTLTTDDPTSVSGTSGTVLR
jgi:hypothetical protein